MIDNIIDDITAYFDYLKEEFGYFAAFHTDKIPLENYMAKLAQYNINSNPYCLCVKSCDDAWRHCIERQPKVYAKCEDGVFFGTCYAGMGEYVFPIADSGEVLGFIDVSGYCFDSQKAERAMKYISSKYNIDYTSLVSAYKKNIIPPVCDYEKLKVRISALCSMFVLLNRELRAIYSHSEQKNTSGSYILSRASVFLNRSYSQNIHVRDIAEHCNCSVSYISHIFKKNMGMSVYDYINRLRINDVKVLLSNTDFSVKQISEMAGYASPNYMSEVFKNVTGLSPRAYRSSFRQNKKV